MKILGGIITAFGIFYLLNAVAIYFVLGKIKEREGGWNFIGVASFGLIITGIGIGLFTRKPK